MWLQDSSSKMQGRSQNRVPADKWKKKEKKSRKLNFVNPNIIQWVLQTIAAAGSFEALLRSWATWWVLGCDALCDLETSVSEWMVTGLASAPATNFCFHYQLICLWYFSALAKFQSFAGLWVMPLHSLLLPLNFSFFSSKMSSRSLVFIRLVNNHRNSNLLCILNSKILKCYLWV